MSDAEEIRLAAESWAARRISASKDFTHASLVRFAETSEAMARKVIHGLDSENPETFDALAELATIASGIVAKRKVFVNGQDVTPPR